MSAGKIFYPQTIIQTKKKKHFNSSTFHLIQVKAEEKKLNDTMKMRQTEEQILNKVNHYSKNIFYPPPPFKFKINRKKLIIFICSYFIWS